MQFGIAGIWRIPCTVSFTTLADPNAIYRMTLKERRSVSRPRTYLKVDPSLQCKSMESTHQDESGNRGSYKAGQKDHRTSESVRKGVETGCLCFPSTRTGGGNLVHPVRWSRRSLRLCLVYITSLVYHDNPSPSASCSQPRRSM